MINTWMVESGYAENNFAAQHINAGLKLNGLSFFEQKTRVIVYRLWRNIGFTSRQAFDCALYNISPADMPDEFQVCGHHVSSIQGDTTMWCGECYDNDLFHHQAEAF